jgi:fumarylpyruvate hydrolase
MPEFVIPPSDPIAVAVEGGGAFPVRRIFCVGRNYAEHAREMGMGQPEPAFFFMKPADALVLDGADMPYPPGTRDLHHEIELVVALGRGGRDIAAEQALDYVWGYAAGIDMTRRDLQADAKQGGRPWEMAKSFDHSAPIGTLRAASRIGHPSRGAIVLSVNGEPRQRGDIADMTRPVPEIIAILSSLVALKPGDLIFTGTPAGVGAVVRGDRIEGSVEGVGSVSVRIG